MKKTSRLRHNLQGLDWMQRKRITAVFFCENDQGDMHLSATMELDKKSTEICIHFR